MPETFDFPDEPAAGRDESHGGGVFFGQACPICGRKLRIAVNLLGRRVYCQHCGGGFVAADAALRSGEPATGGAARACDQAVDALLAKAEAVLARSAGGRRFSR
ncbi:hypothetical protein EBR04_04800 [bacterium]|nr:hypothetical protein [bacterium]